LLSRLFWPGYLLGVAAFLAVVRPWEPWSLEPTMEPMVPVMVHQNTDLGFQQTGDVGIVSIYAEPLSNVPDGWLPCDGRELPIPDYPELFRSLGGDPEAAEKDQTFRLPDFRGLVASVNGGDPYWATIATLRVTGSVDDYGPEPGMTAAALHFLIKTKKTMHDHMREPIEEKR